MTVLNLDVKQANKILQMHSRWLGIKGLIIDQKKDLVINFLGASYESQLDAIQLQINYITTALELARRTSRVALEDQQGSTVSIDMVAATRLNKFIQLCDALDITFVRCVGMQGKNNCGDHSCGQ